MHLQLFIGMLGVVIVRLIIYTDIAISALFPSDTREPRANLNSTVCSVAVFFSNFRKLYPMLNKL
jgi:hypothetical protein